MLACRLIAAFAVLVLVSSNVDAQTGRSPAPRTRYEWNPSPYSGSFNSGYTPGTTRWNSGYNPGGLGYGYGIGYGPGYGYGGYGYGYPLITPPIFVPFGATYGGYGYGPYNNWYGGQWGPSYSNYYYSPVNPFVPPGGVLNNQAPAVVDQPQLQPQPQPGQARRRAPLKKEDQLQVMKPSTPEQQQRSLQHRALGDQQFKSGRFLPAAQSYRKAIAAAEDLPDNYFRLALALAHQRRFDDAVDQLKFGLLLDPEWPRHAAMLASFYGDEVNIEKASMVHRVGEWVRGDVRNPDRIFLLAVLLYLDGDRANARTLFDSAVRVAGEEPHLMAFLNADDAQQDGQVLPAGGEIPAPPAAGVRPLRQSPQPRPPVLKDDGAELREQPVPQRPAPAPQDPPAAPEKFPSLKTPDLPRSSEPPADEASSLPALELPDLKPVSSAVPQG